jgi:hypothetical protein
VASPVDAGRNTTNITTADDPWTVNLPASIGSGDLLIVAGRTGGNQTFNLPGWVVVARSERILGRNRRQHVSHLQVGGR